MFLTIDIGNTRTKAGFFNDLTLVEQANWDGWTLEEVTKRMRGYKPEFAIVSTVAAPVPELVRALSERMQVLELESTTALPFRNTYRTPHTLGKDRLAAVAGAQYLLPGVPCLVIDCGTCIKYELLSADGAYLGGNIAPGAAMRIKAMHAFTARLPEVPVHMPGVPVGYSTETALQNGALRGAVLEIQGFAGLFIRQMPGLNIILSGGDAPFLIPFLDELPLRHEPDLTLYGLFAILKHNIAIINA